MMLPTRSLVTLVVAVIAAVGSLAAAPAGAPRLAYRNLMRAKSTPLSLEMKQALAAPVTRVQQIQALKNGPPDVQQSLLASLRSQMPPISSEATAVLSFRGGVVLTPLAAVYPAGTDENTARASLWSGCVWLSMYTPLPTGATQPPVVGGFPDADEPLVATKLRVPEQGAYMITVTATAVGGWIKPPQFLLGRLDVAEPNQTFDGAGNAGPYDSTQWSALLQLSADGMYWVDFDTFQNNPICWSAVTIRKL